MEGHDHSDVRGERIGKYALIRRLAVGGMAELFLARNTGPEGFEKIVVLKRILPHLAGNADFVEMFQHEARLAATLEHPNIVHVSDFGRAGDDYFLVMAYVHGKDLLTILRAAFARSEALPIAHAVTIGIGIAAGLHYAHQHVGFDGRPLGIVHRDVSPANVLVTYDGHVKVVDFGIAKAAAQTSVTEAGVLKGKAAYMSPEQCRGRQVDRRSDLFSIGVVLWEMTTMSRLYRGEGDLALMNQIVYEDARRPSEVMPDYPPALEAIVMRCLRRDPRERYQTAEQLQRALEEFARDHRLGSSTGALAQYLHALFPARVRALPWADAPAPTVPPTGAAEAPTKAEPLGTPGPTRAGVAPPRVTVPLPTVPAAAGATAPGTPAWGGPPLPSIPPGGSLPGGTSPATTAPGTPPADPRLGEPAASPEGYVSEAFTGPITRSDRRGRAPSRAGWVAAGAVVGALLGGGAWAAWRAISEPVEPPAPADSTSIPDEPAPAAPTPEEVEAMLVLVNQPDPALALDLPRRHRLLDVLRALPDAGSRIDERVTLAMDLRQAADAPDPCARFDSALSRIEAAPEPYFAAVVQHAAVPSGCEGLEVRRAAIAKQLGPPPDPASAD